MYRTINKLALNIILLLLLFTSGCSQSYKPLAHVTGASMKEAATESYATLKDSTKELKGVFFPAKTKTPKEKGQ